MIAPYDLHTHCTFCDGVSSPREMVKSAVSKGFSALGFSSHSFTPFDTGYCMNPDTEKEYVKAVLSLREEYSGQIDIFLGCEQDIYSEIGTGYDYIIGSVHYINVCDGTYMPVDLSKQAFTDGVNSFFGGNYYKAAKEYFKTVSELPEKTSCDIAGHIDLIAKFNDGKLFDEEDKRFLSPALEAADALIKRDIIIEVNTGAISRGYRKIPYPSKKILMHIAEKKGRIVLSGDCHDAVSLGEHFGFAVQFAKSCGFKTAWVLTRDGFKEFDLR